MARRFHCLTLQQFTSLLRRFPFQRTINTVHLHHTRRPNHNQYQGQESLVGLWRLHTRRKGLRDIAQHLLIGPDGSLWLGRNWNQPPASAAGHNGNAAAGPFMLGIIGDFNDGRDSFTGPQRDAALRVIALVQKRFGLAPETLHFHNQMSGRRFPGGACPGTSIRYTEIVGDVRRLHETSESASRGRAEDEGPFGAEMLEIDPVLNAVLAELPRESPGAADPSDAELEEEEMTPEDLAVLLGGDADGGREASGRARAALTPAMKTELRPYVINLNQGLFSSEGEFSTTPGEVDAIFDEYLVRELDAARARKEPLRLLFYAHGGLVSESNALRMAYQQVRWWQNNQVYPIFFVWETGLYETIGQLLTRSRQRVARTLARDIWDYTTDPLIESAARALYGPAIWSGMKRSAERAASPEGGARYVARKLKEFCDRHGNQVELHAVGHSAGAIFHAHFLTAALDEGAPPFRTTHFLAPAIQVAAFHQRLAPRLGNGIDHLSLFTMHKDLERADHCAHVYRKSLLYLLYHALEPEPGTPILGLEACLRSDPELRRLFGLEGTPSPLGEVIWSRSQSETGRNATTSATHGGFDNDAPTMNSVARRVLGRSDHEPIAGFPKDAARDPAFTSWEDQVDWPESLEFLAETGPEPWTAPAPAAPAISVPSPPLPTPAATPVTPPPAAGGRRRALCVGIDRYPQSPLSGCVADARLWARVLRQLGFDSPTLLLDEEASREGILHALSRLVSDCSAGDVVVFQYAGHGTTVPDVSKDEASGDTPGSDEAFCPYDFDAGHLLIDDDVAEVFRNIPPGVNFTCFIDCCHSGTISRVAIGVTPQAETKGRDERPRFIVADEQLIAAHRRFRQSLRRGRGPNTGGPDQMREILFSACLSSEVAWEESGQGEFTRRATQILLNGIDGMTNEQFQHRITAAFGASPRQHPELTCADEARLLSFLQPLPRGMTPGASRSAFAGHPNQHPGTAAQLLRMVASLVDGSS